MKKNLTKEIENFTKDGEIDSNESKFIDEAIKTFGRENIKIEKMTLNKLANSFGLDYKNYSHIGPQLEKLIEEKARIKNESKENINNSKNLEVPKTQLETKKQVSNILNQKEKFRNIELTAEELKNFTAMLISEAGNSIEGRVAVGNVILNRIKFWNLDMNGVLFQKNQFSPVSNGSFKKNLSKITPNDINISKDILNGKYENPIGNATFFQSTGAERSPGNWQRKQGHLIKIANIDGHVFRVEKKFINS